MTERWKTELGRIDRLKPDDDLVERASQRGRSPLPQPRTWSRIATIVVASLMTVALGYGGFVVLRDRTPRGDVASEPLDPSAQNGEFLYAKHADTGWSLFALDPETGVERRLTHGVRDYGSDWSPDGSKVVYDSEGGNGYQIVIADADGSNPVVVGSGEDPAWSPDGTRIAYAGEGGSIWVMNVDGSDAHPVTAGAAAGRGEGQEAAFDWHAAWSPDGSAIAYTRVVAHRYAELPSGNGRADVTLEELRIWNEADDTDVLVTDAYTFLGEVDWSPDGSMLVLTGAPTLFEEETTNGVAWPTILTVASSGGTVTPISPDRETWLTGATWSPDGNWIAYADNYEAITVVKPDGSEPYSISTGEEMIGLSWGVAAPASGTA